MKPKRIFLVRHGQSMGNKDKSTYSTIPDWKVPLTERGIEQSQDAGEYLRNKIGLLDLKLQTESLGVYTSPYTRTRQTLDAMLSQFEGYKPNFIKEDPRLREQEWGNLRSFDDALRDNIEKEREKYGTFFYRFLHGESGADVWDRSSDYLSTLYRDFEKEDFPKNVLIVTHGYTMRILLMRWFHWTVEDFHSLANPRNCDIIELQLGDDEKYHLVTSLKKNPA